ncbi:sugar isomerase domain-containing protein [Arthrospiribacter ruber]|uniref:Sugar isomerase domain-containing protein n=1 Tax=Arthrospiribacter ruber TaxID=2487934 RepID=A0A951MAB3_9BACT|nr:SIS domain-containing protein [Arthrospiribacter ruber]MBW3466212.1 sugar isomerase domain-containing protein [Arthrospiribacter ruber]
MKKAYQKYLDHLQTKLGIVYEQEEKIELAAIWVSNCLQQGGYIYTSGTGHSHMFAEEIFYRAGGFARVVPILDEALMLHKDASYSTEVERREGYAAQILKDYAIGEKDIFIISSNSGRNTVSIEMAMIAKKKGAKVIVITNLKHTSSVDSRHESGKKLYEISDLYFDNGGEIGDAAVEIKGLEFKVGATSTVIGVSILQSIMVQATENLIHAGVMPEVFSSSNSDEGEEHNEALIHKYKGIIKGL